MTVTSDPALQIHFVQIWWSSFKGELVLREASELQTLIHSGIPSRRLISGLREGRVWAGPRHLHSSTLLPAWCWGQADATAQRC